MTNEEIQLKIKEHEDAIAALKKMDSETNFRVKVDGGRYYLIDSFGEIVARRESGYESDDFRYATLNYFRNEEQAQKYREFLLAKGRVTRKIKELNAKSGRNKINPYSIYLSDRGICPGMTLVECKNVYRIPTCNTIDIANKIINDYRTDLEIIFAYED